MTEIRVAFPMNTLQNCFYLLYDCRHGNETKGPLRHIRLLLLQARFSSAYLSWSSRILGCLFPSPRADVTLDMDQIVLFVTLPRMGSVAGPLQSKKLPSSRRGPRMLIIGVEPIAVRYKSLSLPHQWPTQNILCEPSSPPPHHLPPSDTKTRNVRSSGNTAIAYSGGKLKVNLTKHYSTKAFP
jgi:hypothetical protein